MAVEFGIIMILFFLLVSGMIDFGYVLHSWHMTATGAREGARKAATVSGVPSFPSTVEDRVRAAAGTLDQSRLTVTCTLSHEGGPFGPCPAGGWSEDDIVRVTVEYDYYLITPLPAFMPIGDPLHISSMSEIRYEGE